MFKKTELGYLLEALGSMFTGIVIVIVIIIIITIITIIIIIVIVIIVNLLIIQFTTCSQCIQTRKQDCYKLDAKFNQLRRQSILNEREKMVYYAYICQVAHTIHVWYGQGYEPTGIKEGRAREARKEKRGFSRWWVMEKMCNILQ